MKQVMLVSLLFAAPSFAADTQLRVAFGEVDVSPKLDPAKPVYMAGFGHNRKATAIHDPIMARAIVLDDGKAKIALVSVDVVGLFLPFVETIREQLPEFKYVLVSSTHNHEGPDTVGLWGSSPFVCGVDDEYMKSMREKIVAMVKEAAGKLQPAQPRIGRKNIPELLHDGREPQVLHDELVVLEFRKDAKLIGLVVQWNCHPETLGSKNTEISSDYVAATVARLKKEYGCPIVYLTGTVGGLMTSLNVPIKDAAGKEWKDGTFEKTNLYGEKLAEKAIECMKASEELKLAPFEVRTRSFLLPVDNPLYRAGWKMNVLRRSMFSWSGDPYEKDPKTSTDINKPTACRTEIGYLKLGDLEVAAIPGEIYPELVLGKIQDPVDPGADFKDAPKEPHIHGVTQAKFRMIVGLANDEIGYIIPKRQWDEKEPFCYGRNKSQYGEVNSLGAETAPILMKVYSELAGGK